MDYTTAQAQIPTLDYVTCSQGQVYIGHILVDECYDIQYAYRETKEPIYGYNSKYYDAILPGIVAVHGEFSINYKHDQYLQTILNQTTDDNIGTAQQKLDKIVAAKKAQTSAVTEYKATLTDISTRQADLSKRKAELKVLADNENLLFAQSKAIVNNGESSEKALQAAVDNAKKAYTSWYSKLSPADAATATQALADLSTAQDNVLAQKVTMESDIEKAKKNLTQFQVAVDQCKKDIVSINAQIANSTQYLTQTDLSPSQFSFMNNELVYARQDLVAANKKLDTANKALSDENDRVASTTKDAVSKVQEKTDAMNDTVSDSGFLWMNTVKKDAAQKQFDIRKAELALEAAKLANADGSDAANKAAMEANDAKLAKEGEIKGLSSRVQTQIDTLKALKANTNDINYTLATSLKGMKALTADGSVKSGYNLIDSNRVEDFVPTFDIYLYYNDVIHKIIEGCTITGHSHLVPQGGDAIREYFTFIAKNVR